LWFTVLAHAAPPPRTNAADQAVLDAKIAELDASAAEAEELPLGAGRPVPVRRRSKVVRDRDVPSARADCVVGHRHHLPEPHRAAGEVTLMRDDDILLVEELANSATSTSTSWRRSCSREEATSRCRSPVKRRGRARVRVR
jgi:hypothetical protein